MPRPEPSFPRDAAATQKRLLDAAEREFAQRGFAGARLKDIASSAGVQTTLIHHYFSDKQGLYRAVLDRALAPTQTESWNLLRVHRDFEALVRGPRAVVASTIGRSVSVRRVIGCPRTGPLWVGSTREWGRRVYGFAVPVSSGRSNTSATPASTTAVPP